MSPLISQSYRDRELFFSPPELILLAIDKRAMTYEADNFSPN